MYYVPTPVRAYLRALHSEAGSNAQGEGGSIDRKSAGAFAAAENDYVNDFVVPKLLLIEAGTSGWIMKFILS